MLGNSIKFIRKDTKRITFNDYIEEGEKYYMILGKPSKAEQGLVVSELGGIDITDNNFKPKNTDPDKLISSNYMQIAIHIVETNLTTQELTLDVRTELIKEIDKKCPDMVLYIEKLIQKIDETEEGKKPKKIF